MAPRGRSRRGPGSVGRQGGWAGLLDPEALVRHFADADLCVWPAVNEAFGMALLEAQASGLPVVAGAERRRCPNRRAGDQRVSRRAKGRRRFRRRGSPPDRRPRPALELWRSGAAARPCRARSAGRRATVGVGVRDVAAGACRLARSLRDARGRRDRLGPVLCPASARDRAPAARAAPGRCDDPRRPRRDLGHGGPSAVGAGRGQGRTHRAASADPGARRELQESRRRRRPADRRRVASGSGGRCCSTPLRQRGPML